MNNTGKKILILGIVIAVALAGILAFYPTIVAPPTDVAVNNLHKSSLKATINVFSDMKNTTFNDSVYNVAIDKLKLYKSEGFMTEEELDYQTKALVQKYVPVFTKLSHAKFRESTWRESDHKAMTNRIAHLRRLKVDAGRTLVVLGDYETELCRIEQIIKAYKDAKDIAKCSTFVSVTKANSTIQEAERYRTMDPLSNCTDLTVKLAAVKHNIGNSHYSQVKSKVDEMAGYRFMTESSFKSLALTADAMIREYENNRSKYGYNAKTAESLNRKAEEYYRYAKEFYDRKEINITTNSEWRYISSPNSSYRAYESYGNHNIDNANATMYFTIKGYETFTFYVRSDGESAYDYVLVGIDARPTTSSYFQTTKDHPSSGTSFGNYTSVTFNYLDKSSTYTIYVVYRKDGSDHRGTDRGYVLIPYANN